jgi:ribosomal protein L40E
VSHDQLEMFNVHFQYEDEDGIICKKCGVRQPPENFQHMESGEIKRKCRSCQRKHSQVISRLKREIPAPDQDYACPICQHTLAEIASHGQKKLQQWVLDHCHDTDTFRGWICFNCNSGLGSFSDSSETVKRAVQYLERHENANSS